ncbi:hypothetical protein CFII64_29279 [Pseudomonas sp. CFII64]|nr:hypothetical protein CFII64_29279 [Pseudomonas sp. CFII64]
MICRAAAKGHPWPSAAKPASCRFTLQLNIEVRPAWFDGAPKIKIKNKARARARARAALNRRGPYLKCRSEFIREVFVAATQIYGVSTGPFLDKSGPTQSAQENAYISPVGASLLAKDVIDTACCLDKPGGHIFREQARTMSVGS